MSRNFFRTSSRWICLLPFVAVLAVLGQRPAAAQSLPSSYDLRSVTVGASTEAWVPAIQDQGIMEDCWTFASATAINSNLLMQGLLGPASATPPEVQISSWHLSTRNGEPNQLLYPTYSDSNSNWGGFEYQALGYVTRGQGAWTIPNVPAVDPQDYVNTMGGGVVLNSVAGNAFPEILVTGPGPANLSSPNLLPAASQAPAYQALSVAMLDQGFSNNVALPTPAGSVTIDGSTYTTYDFNLGAADPQVAAVKNVITQRGAVTTSMNAAYSDFHFVANPVGSPVPYTVNYVNKVAAPQYIDHEVTIIGWNDNYQITDPNTGTTQTGAWLVQNSWGTSDWTASGTHENDGTFWVSYNDAAIGRTGVAAFQMGDTSAYAPTVLQNELGPMDYADNYVDGQGPLGMATIRHPQVASILTPEADTMLLALGIATQISGVDVTVSIFDDWLNGPSDLLFQQTFSDLDGIGYHLLDLSAGLSLAAQDSIVVQLEYSDHFASAITIGGSGLNGYLDVPDGLSYYYDITESLWHDFSSITYQAYSGSTDSSGGILFLKGIMAVPEPQTGMLLAGAIVLLAGRRIRRRGR